MKKNFVIILGFLCLGYYNSYTQCSLPAQTGNAGLFPNWKCLPCVERGVAYEEVIRIENFDTIQDLIISQLKIDRLTGLPGGLTWESNPPSAVFASGGTGCIDVTGTTSDIAGSYKLGIYVTVWLAGLGNFSGEAGEIIQNLVNLGIIDTTAFTVPNFDYFIRVIEPGETCVRDGSCDVGIRNLNELFSGLTARPNPFSNRIEVSWTSNTDGKFNAKMFDMVGKKVFSKELHVRIGSNKVAIERGELPTGSYLFILTDGRRDMSTKLMVRE